MRCIARPFLHAADMSWATEEGLDRSESSAEATVLVYYGTDRG